MRIVNVNLCCVLLTLSIIGRYNIAGLQISNMQLLDELNAQLDHPHSVLHSIEYLAMDATMFVSDFLYSIPAFKPGVVKIQVCSDCLGGFECLCALCVLIYVCIDTQ